VVVPGRGDEKHALRDCVIDRIALDPRRQLAAEAQVDDPRAVVDRPDDSGGLVDDVEPAGAPVRLHDHQPRVAAEPGQPFAVRDRAGRDRGDERPVPDVVACRDLAGDHAVRQGRLRGEVGRAEIGARVHDRDRHARGRLLHPFRHPVGARRRVLPLVRDPAGRGERERGLRRRHARRRTLDEADVSLPPEPGSVAGDDLNRTQGGEPPHDRRVMPCKQRLEARGRPVADGHLAQRRRRRPGA
jgi:hypothetical protein